MITLLTISQATELLHLSKDTLARMRNDGTGPQYIKIRRRVLYEQQSLNHWLDQQSFNATSEYTKS